MVKLPQKSLDKVRKNYYYVLTDLVMIRVIFLNPCHHEVDHFQSEEFCLQRKRVIISHFWMSFWPLFLRWSLSFPQAGKILNEG